MARGTPQEIAEKWARRTGQSVEDVRRGVQRVTEAPGVAAARAQDALIANFVESVNSGRWAQAVSAVSLQEWQRQTIDKGLARLPQGVQAAQGKMAAVMTELLPTIDAAAARVRSMPNTTFEDRLQRMVTFSREMNAARARLGGRR